jgi:hypothetical protein
MAQEPNKVESLTVRLESSDGEVNATAVASTMSAVVALIMEAQQEISANEVLLVKARPFAKGSFEIPLDLIVLASATMFATSPLIENVLALLKSYFELKNLLQGAEAFPREDISAALDGNDISMGDLTINLLSPSSDANRLMATATEELGRDPTISGVTFIRGDEKMPFISIRRSQFSYYRIAPPSAESASERERRSRETLSIASIVFEGNGKWKFNRKGHIIGAKIEDADFVERVQSGIETFRAGDRLDVALVINQVLDAATNDYLNKVYHIERVFGHDKRKGQQSLLDK